MSARQPMHEHTNQLTQRLRERIRRAGCITFHEWMAEALYDEEDGYYCRRDRERWGREGDYLTSPQRSPLFAATFARYFARLHEELDAPRNLTIIEAGAGAGHFACGVLETLRREHPSVFAATHYVIDETSADAIERARALLAPFTERVAFRRLQEINEPYAKAIVFANELLDSFPVHRVLMRDGQLWELCVACDREGRFVWTERPPSTPRLADYFRKLNITLAEGQCAEVNLSAVDWIALAAEKFQRGFLINVDYGAEARELYTSPARHTGTLRAFQRHQFAQNPLAQPGEQDLTTTVDWTSIKHAGEAAGLRLVLHERQDKFLLRAGLLEQLERMTHEVTSEAEAVAMRAAARHMILPDSMSTSFQVLIQSK